MNLAPNILVFAILLVGITLIFPPEGRKALILRAVNGLLFGISALLMVIVIVEKFPQLGWDSLSMPLLSALSAIFLVKMCVTLAKALPDLFNSQMSTYTLSDWTLYRGSMWHTPTSVYYLRGTDQTGKKIRFYISRDTFLDLADRPYRFHIIIKAYKHTKIVSQTEVSRCRAPKQ